MPPEEKRNKNKWWTALAEKKWLLLFLAIAILLLSLGAGGSGEKASADESVAATHARTEAYRKSLESELAALCSRLRGVGSVSVMITLDGTENWVYASDSRGDGKSEVVVSGGKGLLVSRKYPAVVGVAIICEGGADAGTREELARLASAALGVGLNRIYVGVG